MTTSTPSVGRLPALLEHPVGLAHPGGGAQQDPESAAHARMLRMRRAVRRPSTLWTTRSISLMPMNGAMMPPSP